MKPPPLTGQPEMRHLPRLAPEFYRGFAVVQWTLTLERRATGWLDDPFHRHFRELLLHAAAREGLFCPVYVLMPDHLHLLWMGLRADSDQRNAMKFLRKHLAVELARRPILMNLRNHNRGIAQMILAQPSRRCPGRGDDPRYFQISAPVQPGNSGGALVDERGG